MSSTPLSSYRAGLSPEKLDQALSGLCTAARRTEWLLCRYLADMADGQRFRALGWYSDVQHYAWARFRLGVKLTRERVRIGKALRALPLVEQAFVEGTLSYSRVREVTRVATAETEQQWLELAQRLTMRELERRVAGEVGPKEVCDSPAQATWRTPETIVLSMRMPAETWALLKRAMEGARHAAETSISDAEALEAVAREALAAMAQPDSTDIADPRKALVLYQCSDCRKTELETNAGAVSLTEEAAERLAAGAKRVDLATEGRCEACVGGVMPAAVRRAVLARDRGKCRICGRRRYVDVHHFHPQSEGGEHSRENCGCLCSSCHGAVHDGELRIEGSAEGALTWYDAAGNELGSEEPGRERKGKWLSKHTGAVLRAMGGRGGFTTDALCAASGLRASEVSGALLELVLAGALIEERLGIYSPVSAPGCEVCSSEAVELQCQPAPLRPPSLPAPRAQSVPPEPQRHPVPLGPPSLAVPRAQPALEGPPGPPEAPPVEERFAETERALYELNLAPSEIREELVRALQAGDQHRWSADALCEATGRTASEVVVALLELQLASRVREVVPGVYDLDRHSEAGTRGADAPMWDVAELAHQPRSRPDATLPAPPRSRPRSALLPTR